MTSPQFCTHCGGALPLHAAFCTTCGNPVVRAAAPPPPPPSAPPPPPPPLAGWDGVAPATMVVPATAAPHAGPRRGLWIAVGVAAAVAVLGVAVWLGTRGSDSTATTGGKNPVPTAASPTTAAGTASSTPTTPTVAPTVATAAPVTAAPVTIPVTAPPVATAAPLHPCPTLHYNDNLPLVMCDEGFPVQLLQIRLNLVGNYGLEEDGQFGPASQAAVRAYQTTYGLAVTGVADYPTWRSLFLGAGLPGEDLDGDGVITPNELIYD